MKKNQYILVLFFLAFFSCQSEIERPEGVLQEDEMVALLVDMEITQATLKYDAASEGSKPNYTIAFDKVYKKHNIDKNIFNVNLDFYCAEPLKMKEVYDKVLVKLSEGQAELGEIYLKKKK